jgi:hypothetical protein
MAKAKEKTYTVRNVRNLAPQIPILRAGPPGQNPDYEAGERLVIDVQYFEGDTLRASDHAGHDAATITNWLAAGLIEEIE